MGNSGMITGAFSSVSGKADTVLTTNGDMLYYNSGRQRLPKGSDGEFLKLASGLPSWAAASGKYELLDDHTATGTESTYTFTETLSVDDYARFFVFIRGASSASFQLQMILNTDTSSSQSYSREYYTGGSITVSDVTGAAFCELASTNLIVSGIGNAFNTDIEILTNDLDEEHIKYNATSYRIGSNRWERYYGDNSAVTGNLTSIQIKTSTSTWIAGTEIMTYGVHR